MARDDYLQPYRQASEDFGDDFRVTLWASQKTQMVRFKIFTQMLDLANKHILDAGCSRGDFLAYLSEQAITCNWYTGLDGVEPVIRQARARNFAKATFIHGDFVRNPVLLAAGKPDVICISGTLNTMTPRQMQGVLHAAWAATGEALLFNFLSDLATSAAARQTYPARRHDTRRVLQWAAECTGHIVYRQDYLPHGHDATILMLKENSTHGRG